MLQNTRPQSGVAIALHIGLALFFVSLQKIAFMALSKVDLTMKKVAEMV